MTAGKRTAELEAQLSGIAAHMVDIAGCVAAEAETATAVVRSMTEQAARVASLAAILEGAANVMETGVRQQSDALALARTALSTNKPVVDALAQSADGVASISAIISRIAQESRTLSFNARIEAARASVGASAFAVIATEMSTLTSRTKSATDEIGKRALAIARDVNAANEIVAAHGTLVIEQDDLLVTSLGSATQQRDTAVELAAITAEMAGTVERTASAIGRLGANAVAVKMLARQLSKLAASQP